MEDRDLIKKENVEVEQQQEDLEKKFKLIEDQIQEKTKELEVIKAEKRYDG